jgi:hypothetical protein
LIPSAWVGVVLGLAAYRLTRLAGWDEFPLALRIRAWIIGEAWHLVEALPDGAEKVEDSGRVDAAELGLPGKQPSTPVSELRPAYSRPTLAHLFRCPFCIGWWISLSLYVAWIFLPQETLYFAAPFAISGFVGIVAKNLDA